MKKLIPFILVAMLLLGFGLVAAQGGLPGSGWLSGQQVQNVGTGAAKVILTAYKQDGGSTPCGERDVPPGSSTTWQTATDCPVDAGFIGSAVVSADQSIVAIVNVSNSPVGNANGQYQGTDGTDVDNTIVFPLVKHNHVNRTTTFYVQNASTSPANITANYKMRDGSSFSAAYNNVPANAMVIVMPSDASVPGGNGQVGSLIVTGNQPLAGSALEHEHSAAVAVNLQASKAFTANDYANKAYCPLYRSEFGGQKSSTGVQVQNVSSSSQEITMKFIPRDGSAPTELKQTAAANASVTFYAPNEGFSPGDIGSVEVTSAGDLVAVVNEQGENGKKQTTYACFSADAATDKINVPLAKELFVRNTTGIQIQNVGSSDAVDIRLTYTDSKNSANTVTLKNAAAVKPGASFTVYEPSSNPSTINVLSGNLSSILGKNNSVVITSDQPIVAIANEIDTDKTRNQDNKNYEGFNQ